MSLFTYNRDIPDGPNNPSNDQPKMQVNTNSIDDLLAIDHVSFNVTTAPNGTHLQTTFSSKNAAGAQIDPQSVLYTGNGTASTVAEMFYRNQNGILPISSIKAYGSFTVVAGGSTFINNFNCTLLTNGSGQISTISLTPNVTTSTTFIVIPFITGNQALTYDITGVNTFTLTTGAGGVGQIISFIVLQA